MKFIDKQLAIKLKEKGFDKPCINAYNAHGHQYLNGWCEYLDERDTDFIYLSDLHDRDCLCPTIDQVIEWLREEKDIDIVIYPVDRNTIYMGGEKYILSIYCCGKRDYKIHESNNDKFVKWEDACIAGIEYVINNLI